MCLQTSVVHVIACDLCTASEAPTAAGSTTPAPITAEPPIVGSTVNPEPILWTETEIPFTMQPFEDDLFENVKDDLKQILEMVIQDFIFEYGDSDNIPALLTVCPDTPAPTPVPVVDPVPIGTFISITVSTW